MWIASFPSGACAIDGRYKATLSKLLREYQQSGVLKITRQGYIYWMRSAFKRGAL